MRIHISIEPTEFSDYINISPLNGQNPFIIPSEDSECTEILAPEILDFIPVEQFNTVMTGYMQKLRHGGRLILGGTDLMETLKSYITGMIDSIQVNHILYGNNKHAWSLKRASYSLHEVADYFDQLGYKILKKRIATPQMLIEVQRP